MSQQERARERARETISQLLSGRYKEGQWIYDVPNLGAALEEALLNFRKEGKEEAANIAESHAWDYSTYPSRVGLVQGIAQAIRKLEED